MNGLLNGFTLIKNTKNKEILTGDYCDTVIKPALAFYSRYYFSCARIHFESEYAQNYLFSYTETFNVYHQPIENILKDERNVVAKLLEFKIINETQAQEHLGAVRDRFLKRGVPMDQLDHFNKQLEEFDGLISGPEVVVSLPQSVVSDPEQGLEKEILESVVSGPGSVESEPKVVVSDPKTKKEETGKKVTKKSKVKTKESPMLVKYLTPIQINNIFHDLLKYIELDKKIIPLKSEKDFLEKFLAGDYEISPTEVYKNIRYNTWRRGENDTNFAWVLIKRAAFLKSNKKPWSRYVPNLTKSDKFFVFEVKDQLDLEATETIKEIIDLNGEFHKNIEKYKTGEQKG